MVSGKGGVGKSLITSLLATTLRRRGNQVAVLDADITGPSIPKCFGMKQRALSEENGNYQVERKNGSKEMSNKRRRAAARTGEGGRGTRREGRRENEEETVCHRGEGLSEP